MATEGCLAERVAVPGRWIRRGTAISGNAACKACGIQVGVHWHSGVCPVLECRACGSPQCASNALGSGHCGICWVGILDGWGEPPATCRYKGCTAAPVAIHGKTWPVCAAHLERRLPHLVSRRVTIRKDHWFWCNSVPAEPEAVLA